MPGRGAFIVMAASAFAVAATPAGAVLKGTRSQSLAPYTVRLVGDGNCSGVVVARRLVATARHCAYGMAVVAAHRYYRVARVLRLGRLDDGRYVTASGDSSFLQLSKPLPETVAAVPVGIDNSDEPGDTFVIAGYGGGRELRQASLVAESEHTLVDPEREGSISASACFGDSGGPVIRGGWLVGVITRAAYPSSRRACGYLTRWAPISIATEAEIAAGKEKQEKAKKTHKARKRVHRSRRAHAKQAKATGWLIRFRPR